MQITVPWRINDSSRFLIFTKQYSYGNRFPHLFENSCNSPNATFLSFFYNSIWVRAL
ncbi:hypothetical protein C2G38_1523941 [Gigaspora rosea]|uniref:Uncharacterized protein n=1 Tax=Gigaspora rosea TaxID=44941 RepID=A0A397W287_9GLOM|nr:hypothetical protein C2G38_1523941 [Gigaspora rosea]